MQQLPPGNCSTRCLATLVANQKIFISVSTRVLSQSRLLQPCAAVDILLLQPFGDTLLGSVSALFVQSMPPDHRVRRVGIMPNFFFRAELQQISALERNVPIHGIAAVCAGCDKNSQNTVSSRSREKICRN